MGPHFHFYTGAEISGLFTIAQYTEEEDTEEEVQKMRARRTGNVRESCGDLVREVEPHEEVRSAERGGFASLGGVQFRVLKANPIASLLCNKSFIA